MPMETFSIKPPEMDLVLGLAWLGKTIAVPNYDNMSYPSIDDMNKVLNVIPYNESDCPQLGLNSIVPSRSFDNDYLRTAYETASETESTQ
ncbi:hypothetical protein MJO28_013895 [Puccinia striiformis f. sp. tritici]|uniref:Uncharacterized protein n=1 Tax=Puccinia striiformis f. sp. tritici TaxID=168172 RepID=A0ACC0DX51_9BASI|nr:hypothetical protein MJO28_013895 [Puccinia striiformis f. sp. tritici]KAI7941665.1 hypothetical protein MJO29_013739 [Puccinia striiformis f. sp. tritici]